MVWSASWVGLANEGLIPTGRSRAAGSAAGVTNVRFSLQHLSLAATVGAIVAGASLTYILSQESRPSSPDESTVLFYSKLFAERGSLVFRPSLNEHYNTTIFAPRLSFQVGPNAFTTFYPWFAITLASFQPYVSYRLLMVSTTVFAWFAAVLIARRLEVKAHLAIIPALVFAGPFLFLNGKVYGNSLAATEILVGILCLVAGFGTSIRASAACFSVMFVGAILLRDDSVVAAVAVAPFVLQRRFQIKAWILRLAGPASAAVLALALFTFLPKIVDASYDLGTSLREKLGGIIGSPRSYLHAAAAYLAAGTAAAPLVAASPGVAGRSLRGRFLLAAVFVVVAYLLAFGARVATWRYQEATPDASLHRYFLVPLTLLTVACFLGLEAIRQRGGQSIALICILLLCSTSYMGLVSSSGQFIEEDRTRLERISAGYEPINALGDGWVFFTKSQDKYIVNTALSLGVYRTARDIEIDPDLALFFQPTDLRQMLVPAVEDLLASNHRVLVDPDAGDLLTLLRSAGHPDEPFPGTPVVEVLPLQR